jgi:acyl-CoA dehydrogenase
MDMPLTEAQRQLQDEFARYLQSLPFDRTYWQRKEQDREWPTEFCRSLADAGWLGALTPEEFGGSGLGLTEGCLIVEAIARYGGINASTAVHTSIFGLHPVTRYGSDEQKRRVLPRIAKGEFAAFGLTEADSGFDSTRIATRAVRQGNKWVLNGSKVFCSRVRESTMLLIAARTTPIEEVARRTDGISLFIAELDWSTGQIDAHEMLKMGRNAVPTYQFFMENWELPPDALVGEEGKGFYHLLDALNPERIAVAAQCVGLGLACVEKAAAYSKERIVFGRPIGQNQGLQFPLADSYCKLQSARLLMYHAAQMFDTGKPCGAEANMVKYLAAEAGFEAADRAVQTHGGYGYVSDFDVERFFRELRLMKIAPVSQEMVLNYIAQHALDMPRSY